MGAKPLFALNIIGFPIKTLSKEVLSAILRGGSDKTSEAGIPIVGGHSIDDKEPKYGLVVTGEVTKSNLIKNSEAKEGDVLVLTKPLGTGIISTAIKNGNAPKAIIDEAINCMSTLNQFAGELMCEFSVHAATDITGYGLLGHLNEMCKASQLSAEINFDVIPFIDGVESLAKSENISSGSKHNLDHANDFTYFDSRISEKQKLMVSDAQTSGGLLVSLPEKAADEFAKRCTEETGLSTKQIGFLSSKKNHRIIIK